MFFIYLFFFKKNSLFFDKKIIEKKSEMADCGRQAFAQNVSLYERHRDKIIDVPGCYKFERS